MLKAEELKPAEHCQLEEKITFPGQGGISGHLLDVREMRIKSGTSFC